MKLKKYQFKKVKSTNDVAIKKIKSGIRSGIVLAETQTKGRGQYGKKWISYKGNLFMSIFFGINTSTSIKDMTYKNCKIIRKSIQKLKRYPGAHISANCSTLFQMKPAKTTVQQCTGTCNVLVTESSAECMKFHMSNAATEWIN